MPIEKPCSRIPPPSATYTGVGVALALTISFALLLVRAAQAASPFGWAWVMAELRSQALTYVYLSGTSAALLALCGFLVGRREGRLWRSAITDPLTSISNRRHFELRLDSALGSAGRGGMPLSLLVIDVDDLKRVNDRHGHRAGDLALRLVAEALHTACRSRDLLARYGGDEFVVIAARTRGFEAAVLADRIRVTLAELVCRRPFQAALTVSVGVADLAAAGAPTAEALFGAADRALYRAKESGRDRTVVAVPPPLWDIGAAKLKRMRPEELSPRHDWAAR